MKNYLEVVRIAKLEENDKGQLKQNVRNQFRTDLVDALCEALVGLGLEAKLTEDGIGVEIPNEDLGAIPVVISATVKDLAYSVDEANADYVAKLQAKAEAEKAKAEAKAKAIADKEALKALKANKKKA